MILSHAYAFGFSCSMILISHNQGELSETKVFLLLKCWFCSSQQYHTYAEICCLKYLGISIVEEDSGPNGVTMEFDMQWDGNPNIVLDIKTKVGVVLPVQVIHKSLL